MTTHTSDESILAKIQGLVHEEQRLYGQDALSDHDRRVPPASRRSLTLAELLTEKPHDSS